MSKDIKPIWIKCPGCGMKIDALKVGYHQRKCKRTKQQ